MKVLLFIVIGIVALLVLLGIGGYFLGNSLNEIVAETGKEAEAFASNANKEQCLEKSIDKYLACEELSCYMSMGSFGIICLDLAAGSREEFCADKPKSQTEFYQSDWKSGLCADKGLDTASCANIFKVVETYCEN